MILTCKVHCWAMLEEEAEQMNIPDPGTWIKAAFDLREIKAIKHSSDDITDPLYYCTTIYGNGGDSFTINVPYDRVLHLWTKTLGGQVVVHSETDIEL